MNFRSHTKEAVVNAQKNGAEIWEFDTGNEGEGDVLIGTEEHVRNDILCRYWLESLPKHWKLIKVNWELSC